MPSVWKGGRLIVNLRMEKVDIANQKFEGVDYTKTFLQKGEYDNCSFINCNFANTDLSNISFTECEFNTCDMSTASLSKTAFRDVKFIGCKLLGLHFQDCNEIGFEINFDNCILNLSSFYKRKLKKTTFKNSSLLEVDFTEADLTESVFDNCDFANATFDNTILEKADLRTSYNYSIDPAANKIKKAKFSIEGIRGLLDRYDIVIE